MNDLTKEQKKEIKSIIKNDCIGFLEDIDRAKDGLNGIAKLVNENFYIKPAKFKKMCKVAYLDSIEEEKAKSEEFYNDYKNIMEVEN